MEQDRRSVPGQQQGQGLWDFYQHQQQGSMQSATASGVCSGSHSPSFSSPNTLQTFSNCPAAAPATSQHHPGAVPGKHLTSLPLPPSYQLAQPCTATALYNGVAPATAMPGVQHDQQRPLVAPPNPHLAPGATLHQFSAQHVPQHAQQQPHPPSGPLPSSIILPHLHPVAPLSLSGAALAAAAHLRPPPASTSLVPPPMSGGLPGVSFPLASSPTIVTPTLTASPAGATATLSPITAGQLSPPTHVTIPMVTLPRVKPEPAEEPLPSSSPSHTTPHAGSGGLSGEVEGSPGASGSVGLLNKSRYRGVSYDRKKGKWRVQIKVAALGKSGVSVGYFDTEEAAARAYDRAAIGLLGLDNPNLQTNFSADDYAGEAIPRLSGKSREEVKSTLKSERIKQAPRRRFTTRQRTSRFMGVGSSNRKNQWQARILVQGKVTHLGYYETEEEAARVYDRVSLALHGEHAQTNFASSQYSAADLAQFQGLEREDLQRALGVKPMDKSSRYRGVSKKKGKWEAKVMVNRRWAYRELFDSEEEAARAYDRALWRLKPKEAHSYVNFKDHVPPEVSELGEGDGGCLHGMGGGVGSSDEAASGLSEEVDSDDEDMQGYDAELAAIGHMAQQSASGRPRRVAAAAQMHSIHSANSARSRAAPVQVAPPAGSMPWALHPHPQQAQQHGTAGQVLTMKGSGSAPNLAAMDASAFGATSAAPPGTFLPQGGMLGAGLPLPSHLLAAAPTTSPPMVPASGGMGYTLPFPPQAPAPQVPLPAQHQPLLVRVGSETHLISHHQQHHHNPYNLVPDQHPHGTPAQQQAVAQGGGPAGSLGKRLSRIHSEPHFPSMTGVGEDGCDLLGPAPGQHSVDAELEGLMADRDLFKDMGVDGDFGSLQGDDDAVHSMSLDAALDTDGILDFIKDLPDVNPVTAAAGGMFKSRSAVNLSALSSVWDEEEDAALASLEFSRPKKMSRSVSATHLAAAGQAPQHAQQRHSPPRSASSQSSDSSGGNSSGGERLGPLGKPIRRTNTFTTSLAPLEEKGEERGGGGAGAGAGGGEGAGEGSAHGLRLQQHNSHSGDDLVHQLLGTDASSYQQPQQAQQAAMDDALQVFREFAAAS